MAYEILAASNGVEEIRCTSGKVAHIKYSQDHGNFSVVEDESGERFQNHGPALDRARLICGDPDLR